MAEQTGAVQFNPSEVGKNFVKWRKDLLTIPVEDFRKALGKVFEIHTGVRYQEKVGILTGDMQLAPYDPMRKDTEGITINARTLEVFLGSAVKAFDPNTAIQSIWDEYVAKGEKGKSIPFVKYVAGYLTARISENLALHVWDGVRNPSGTTTKDLCDGIETIIDKEITAGNISVANGNLVAIEDYTAPGADTEAIFKSFYRAADRKLRAQKTFLICSEDEYLAYCDSYQENHGALPYNKEYEKSVLEGTQSRCTILPTPNVADGFLKLVPAGNFVMGTNINGEETQMMIEKSNTSHFMVDFIATMFLGYQIQRIEKEFLCVGKVIDEPEPEPEPEVVETPTFSPADWGEGETVAVTIACATDGASIYYTTDGTTPTAESTAYTEAITLSATTTVKAIAVKAGMTASEVASKTYTKA